MTEIKDKATIQETHAPNELLIVPTSDELPQYIPKLRDFLIERSKNSPLGNPWGDDRLRALDEERKDSQVITVFRIGNRPEEFEVGKNSKAITYYLAQANNSPYWGIILATDTSTEDRGGVGTGSRYKPGSKLVNMVQQPEHLIDMGFPMALQSAASITNRGWHEPKKYQRVPVVRIITPNGSRALPETGDDKKTLASFLGETPKRTISSTKAIIRLSKQGFELHLDNDLKADNKPTIQVAKR